MSQLTFISHACADDPFVHKLARDLADRDIAVWLSDWHRESGITWPDKLAKAIRDSPLFMLVMSPASRRSQEVEKELDQAQQLRKVVVPVWYQDCEVFERVSLLDYEDFRSGDYGHALANLRRRLTGVPTEAGEVRFGHGTAFGSQSTAPMRLAAPMSETDQQGRSMTLRWSEVPHAEYYEVQKSENQFFTDAFIAHRGAETFYSVPHGVILFDASNLCYWRVRAVAVAGHAESEWSNVCIA